MKVSLAQKIIRLRDGYSKRKTLNENQDHTPASFYHQAKNEPNHKPYFPPISSNLTSGECPETEDVKNKYPVRRKRYLHAPLIHDEFLKASYSLEAALIMPLFLYAMIAIIFMMRIIGVQHGVKEAIDDTAKLVSVCGGNFEGHQALEPNSFSVAAVATTKIAQNKTPIQFVKFGIAGFNFLKTEVTDKDVTIIVSYYMKVPLAPDFGHKGFLITQRAYAKRFTGYHIEDADDESEEYVYVTKYGEAYHTDLNCSYLKLSIRSVSDASLPSERNNNGHKYYSCQYCGRKGYGSYYITDDGECYHTRLDCPGLKRTINRIKKEDAESKYHACAKCVKQ